MVEWSETTLEWDEIMSVIWIALGVVVVSLLVAGPYLFRRLGQNRGEARQQAARRSFIGQREHLEAKFVDLADANSSPRGLRWANCEFSDGVSFALDRASGELTAFVGIAVSFEAIEGGGMEEVEAVSNVRAATAVFHHTPNGWTTRGRAVMNLEPDQAIEHFSEKLDALTD